MSDISIFISNFYLFITGWNTTDYWLELYQGLVKLALNVVDLYSGNSTFR